MDPVTQGVVGAALPQSAHKSSYFVWVGLCGLLGGMAPDLDTFIRSDHDPLLYLEYHRHFTHALIFIPLGGFLVSIFLHALFGKRKSIPFWQTYLFCTLGYGTHGLLDAMTSYGTMLFWPFSDMRVAFNIVSVIDPLFTVPIVLLVGVTIFKNNAAYARIALIWAIAYLGLGAYQHITAIEMGKKLAQDRGHIPFEATAKPSFANILVWKLIYRHEDRYYVDAARVSWRPKIYQGTSIPALDVNRDFPWLKPDSQQAKDVQRFAWFSKNYVAKDPYHPNRIIDLRYSQQPNQITGLWSITLSPEASPETHARYMTHRSTSKDHLQKLLSMVFD